MAMRLNYAIIYVSDMVRSLGFYRDITGLPLRFETPEWTEFSTDGATLALHKANKPRTSQSDTQATAAGRCSPGFGVLNLDEFHSRLTEQGVACVQIPKKVFGSRIAQYLDPDGLMISVSEIGRMNQQNERPPA
jgi:catechol 2,3-dioxygenase-like lactoylglutathione lyase family enzyme